MSINLHVEFNVCAWWYPRFKDLKELWNKHVFHIFDVDLRSKLMFMHEHVMNNQEHVKNN